MKRIIYFILFILIIIGIFFIVGIKTEKSSSGNAVAGATFKEKVTEQNFPSYLNAQPMIKGLPEKSLIQLIVGEKNYTIKNKKVVEGNIENPDIIVYFNKDYIPEFNNGLCETLKKARNDGALSWNTKVSTFKILFKYNSLLEYKSCLV